MNKPKLILHIEDDEDDQLLVKEVIQSLGNSFLLEHANNGEEGWSLLLKAKEVGELPSLVILDINMPFMDGRELMEHINMDPILSKVPLVVFSTSNHETDRDFYSKYNIPYMVKPLRVKEFEETVHELLNHCSR